MKPRRELASLSESEIRELAGRRDTIIMQPEYDHFEPWPESRVRACVKMLCSIARRAKNTEEARAEALKKEELKQFSTRYVKMWERFSDPQTAQNESHVNTLFSIITLHEQMRAGQITETAAKAKASDIALAGLMNQVPNAPTAPAEAASRIEELD